MHFRPSQTIDGRTAIEVWDGDQHAATLYAQRQGLHLICEPGYSPAALDVEPHEPAGVHVAIARSS